MDDNLDMLSLFLMASALMPLPVPTSTTVNIQLTTNQKPQIRNINAYIYTDKVVPQYA